MFPLRIKYSVTLLVIISVYWSSLLCVSVPPGVLQVWSRCCFAESLRPTTPSTTCLPTPRTGPNRSDLEDSFTTALSCLFQHTINSDLCLNQHFDNSAKGGVYQRQSQKWKCHKINKSVCQFTSYKMLQWVCWSSLVNSDLWFDIVARLMNLCVICWSKTLCWVTQTR